MEEFVYIVYRQYGHYDSTPTIIEGTFKTREDALVARRKLKKHLDSLPQQEARKAVGISAYKADILKVPLL